jgi:2-polyprenyl-3-methyl-5-hydroxy-6-metoxy-1,4-benzoquinol methylase
MERWKTAQASEATVWQQFDADLILDILRSMRGFVGGLDDEIRTRVFGAKAILEVGCGPYGICVASFQKAEQARRLIKVDPLPPLDFSKISVTGPEWETNLLNLAQKLQNDGDYIQFAGEDLDYSNAFDSAIIYNVLDHVREPLGILQSCFRALRPGGIVLIAVDCRSLLGKIRFEQYTRRVLKDSVLVHAHPHTFLVGDVMHLLKQSGFTNERCLEPRSTWEALVSKAKRRGFVGYKRT